MDEDFKGIGPELFREGYESLSWPIAAMLHRVAYGKGKTRHQDHEGQLFMDQDICRAFSHAGRIDQIRKKAKESLKFRNRRKAMNEILDVMAYAAAEWLVLYEEEGRASFLRMRRGSNDESVK